MRKIWLGLVLLLCMPASAVASEEASDDTAQEDPAKLDTVVVSAARSERPLHETAGTVTVITAEEIERTLAQDIRELVRYEPGVVVTSDATRFGLGGFEIRGIGGNRVLTEIDGVPVADAFAIGSFSNAGRNFVDPELLKRVEILRGSASALYGSDAVGGVVTMTTKDPADYLRDDNAYTAVKFGYNSDNSSTVATILGAYGGVENGLLFAYTRRDGEALDNQGSNEARDDSRTAPNPQDYSADNLLLKGVFDRGDDVFRISLDAHQSSNETDVLSSLGTQDFTPVYGFPYIVETQAMRGDDLRSRERVSGEWTFERASALLDKGSWLVYAQHSETEQDTFEQRSNTVMGMPSIISRERTFMFEQDIVGTTMTMQKSLEVSDGPDHLFVYGFEVEQADTVQVRDGLQTDLTTGDTTNVVTPDEFPVRDFPPSKALEGGIFLQDEIQWEDFTLIPGVRVDYYSLDPEEDDPVFMADNPGVTPVKISETNVSPKLGMLYDFDKVWSGFFQYARGFRAPPYNDVNVGFTNLAFGYTAIPNPDLKPEISDHYEIGLRRSGERSAVAMTVFHNRYDDFIEPFVSLGVDPGSGLLVFQSQNLTAVTTEGIELKIRHDLVAIDGLRLHASAAYARGEDDANGEPLNSIAPLTGVFGTDYTSPSGNWGLEFVGTLVAGKDEDGVDESAGELFMPAGYGKFDLIGWYAFTPDVKLHAGIFNVTDRKYWNWSNVRGRPANDPVIDRYTAPGINASVSLRVAF